MVNIYAAEGVEGIVNFAEARAELKRSGAITDRETRRAVLAEITAAALLDIAYSLRPVGAEAADAINFGVVDVTSVERDPAEPDPEAATPDDFFVVGDLVAVATHSEPAEIRSFGVDQGVRYADVLFASGADAKIWLSHLTRIVGDESDDDAMQEAAEASVEAIHVETGDAYDGEPIVDVLDEAAFEIEPEGDVDADFEPASALDALKANEAARKGKKGGRK